MYIKRLVMHGFKSFPRKTEIPFTPGINVVLGPNGSGKSNVSDAICFVLGRLSVKSLRAARASNLIFLGSKEIAPAKEAMVEIVLDNSEKVFTLNSEEISIKRVLRKNGQSIYKINNETKTRQDILALLAQAGIDPQGFNIILQGEIQNFVRMHPEDRRGVLEEVSGVSIYESRKEKSLHELDKTDERLKEIGSILRERTAYLANLEKERQQALKYKKLEADIIKLKASVISHDFNKKKKEAEIINSDINEKSSDLQKVKKFILGLETEVKNIELKIAGINNKIKESTGLEQEHINQEIANLRAELAGLHVKKENFESKIGELGQQKKDATASLASLEDSVKQLRKNPSASVNEKELGAKKKELDLIETARKKFYASKSELKMLREREQDKVSLAQNYSNESIFLFKQIEALATTLSDKHSSSDKLDKLKHTMEEKKDSLNNLQKRETELEKNSYVAEAEIQNNEKTLAKISKLDICPVCKSKITRDHMDVIRRDFSPKTDALKKQIDSSDRELKEVYEKKALVSGDIEALSDQISRTVADIAKLNSIEERKGQIKSLEKKAAEIKEEISGLERRRKKLEEEVETNANIDSKYESLRIEVQEISIRSKETVSSEVSFKEHELERLRVSIKQLSHNLEEMEEEFSTASEALDEKQGVLEDKKEQEQKLAEKFREMLAYRDSLQGKIRDMNLEISKKQHEARLAEQQINDLKIDKARVDAEAENFSVELAGFHTEDVIRAPRDVLLSRLSKAQEIIASIGSVNLRSLEVYDSIKKEYDSIKDRADLISKEKESILKVIHEIDVKKKKAFLQTTKTINELFTRNFSQLSQKGQVYLEIENEKDPFESGAGVSITLKTGHGKYFDVKSLSGGEQTLVALSLIFAIQEFKPYHFYLLDEIDAALDKRNSERLAGLLNKYMRLGQYIVISHNDEVISKATNLYGVSMHEGISKIISLKV